MLDSDEKIVATKIPENRRSGFLPKLFGAKHMMQGEGLVYGLMRRICRAYDGGFWNLYELSNGGFYMAPEIAGKLQVTVPDGNDYDGEMSADAAGIVATLMALSHLSFAIAGTPECDAVSDHFHLLRDFVGEHPEGREIFAAID